MVSWTLLMHIHPNSIDQIFDTCAAALDDAREVVARIGYDDDLEHLDFELHEVVTEDLVDIGIDAENITNSIIGACLNTTRGFLANTELFRELGLDMDYYVNGLDSHLYLENHGDGDAPELVGEGDLKDILYNLIAERIFDIVDRQLVEDIDSEAFKKTVADMIENDEFNTFDVLACLKDGEVKGTLRELVNEFENERNKDALERE